MVFYWRHITGNQGSKPNTRTTDCASWKQPGLEGRKPGAVTDSLHNQGESKICLSFNVLIFQRDKNIHPTYLAGVEQTGEGRPKCEFYKAPAQSPESGRQEGHCEPSGRLAFWPCFERACPPGPGGLPCEVRDWVG